jgi:ribosomal-protein-alanine N-acetyltransferase
MIIKKATGLDIRRIDELERAIFSDPWSKPSLIYTAGRDYFKVAVSDSGIVIGYIAAVGDDNETDLQILAVDENFRRQGVAQQLLETLLTDRPNAKIWLEVRENNAPARTFYEKNGFIIQYVRKDYYRNPIENAVVMLKTPPRDDS